MWPVGRKLCCAIPQANHKQDTPNICLPKEAKDLPDIKIITLIISIFFIV